MGMSALDIPLRQLDTCCETHRAGAVFTSPGELALDALTLVQPAVYVLPLVQGRRPRAADEMGTPLLLASVRRTCVRFCVRSRSR
jgi:hypothetical protein